MVIAASVVLFFILGLFLSMLGSSPKSDKEWQTDTDGGDEVPMSSAPVR